MYEVFEKKISFKNEALEVMTLQAALGCGPGRSRSCAAPSELIKSNFAVVGMESCTRN